MVNIIGISVMVVFVILFIWFFKNILKEGPQGKKKNEVKEMMKKIKTH